MKNSYLSILMLLFTYTENGAGGPPPFASSLASQTSAGIEIK